MRRRSGDVEAEIAGQSNRRESSGWLWSRRFASFIMIVGWLLKTSFWVIYEVAA